MRTHIGRRVRAFEIDTSHFSRGRRYTEASLSEAVSNSESVAGVLRYLGLIEAGGTHAHVSRTIKRLGLDTSHFRRDQGARVKATRLTPEQVLVMDPSSVKRTKPNYLRRALVESGRLYCCESCGCDGRWQGQPLTLHVDHISGDYRDNRPENLRFLCPNCHSQTSNFAGRSRGFYSRLQEASQNE